MTKPVLLGFSEPIPATKEQMAEAIMFGKCLHRDDEASYYEYRGDVLVLPRKPADAQEPKP